MIAVTGVSGFAGNNLAQMLVARGDLVRGVIHQDTLAIQNQKIEHVRADLLDLDSLVQAFEGVEIVFHLAGMISLSVESMARMEAINVQGTNNVIEACRQAGVRRLIHFSSIHALIQKPYSTPVDEERPLALDRRQMPYDRTKAAGELAVRQAIAEGLDAVILNPTGIFGPNDYRPSFFGQALLLMANGRLPALVRGGFDWVDVRDVASAAIRAAEVAPAGARYLLSGYWRSVHEIARQIAGLTGTRSPRFRFPRQVAYLSAPVVELAAKVSHTQPLYTRVSLKALQSNQHISHTLATRDLDYQPRPFEVTLHDTLAWFASHGDLQLKPNSPLSRGLQS